MRILIAVIAGALIATASFAAPACTTGTYATYATSGFSCTEGDATFGTFSPLSFVNSGGVPTLTEDNIEVIPGGTLVDPTLTFVYVTPGANGPVAAPVTVNTLGQIFSFGFNYEMVLTGATLSNLQMDSTFMNTSPGSASATKNAQLLSGGTTFSSSVGDGGVSNPLATYQGAVTPVTGTGTWVINDTTSLQAQSGSVTQDSFENLFESAAIGTTTPEPMTSAMIGSGLLLIGLIVRRGGRGRVRSA